MKSIAPKPSDSGNAFQRVIPKRQKASNACETCRERKAKCIFRAGSTACDVCIKYETDCTLNPESDMRKKGSLKRKLEELESTQKTLLRLVGSLQDSSHDEATTLFNLIRSKAGLEEIESYMDRQTALLQTDDTAVSSETSYPTGASHRALDIQRLIDIPNYQIPAKPWTSVTDDNELVCHLVSVFFTWIDTFYNFVEKEAFMRDANLGDLQSQFCSPFLVNCILAIACMHSDYLEAYADPSDPNSKGLHFYEEAKRQYQEIEGLVDIPTIQGIGISIVFEALQGKDKVSWMYVGQITGMVEHYEATHAITMSPQSRAVNTALWGAYNVVNLAGMCLMKGHDIAIPNRPRLTSSHDRMNDTWLPYPRQDDPTPAHTSCMVNSFRDLSVINSEAIKILFDNNVKHQRPDLGAAISHIYDKLEKWRSTLPECMQLENANTPHILCLHMFYHTILMIVWGHLKYPVNTEETNEESISPEDAKKICIDSAHSVLRILQTQRSAWGIDYANPTLLHWLSISLFTLLEELDDLGNRNAFIELCVMSRLISRKSVIMKGILRMLQGSAKQNNISLPVEVDALFVEFEDKIWNKEGKRKFRSLYPNLISMHKTGGDRSVEDSEMESFLNKWNKLNIEEEAGV
ncbi:hypothetical protein BDW74DRAFT_188479 [Aspergillus multicolor]|uniref:Zn(II)2Cys6 transcription factor n=1 Tax=Aspergillus multicolor TaxID=41759 RepID=UPI003CCC9635